MRARARPSYLHTVIKFLLSTAPFLAAAFFRAPLNPRLGDAMPASGAVLRCSLPGCLSHRGFFFLFLSPPPVLSSSRGPAACSRRRVAETEAKDYLGFVSISHHCSPLKRRVEILCYVMVTMVTCIGVLLTQGLVRAQIGTQPEPFTSHVHGCYYSGTRRKGVPIHSVFLSYCCQFGLKNTFIISIRFLWHLYFILTVQLAYSLINPRQHN